MREMLFRGKRLDNGEWVYGWYLEYPFGRWPVKPAIVPAESARSGRFEFVMVDPATVGQFTGYFDRHEKRIFEGHILLIIRNGRKYVCAVKDIRNLPDFMFESSVENIEIVSDIYDPMWKQKGEDNG